MKFELFDYQASAADLMASRDRFGLHDEMGIGKTATTIGALDRVNALRGVVVCPAMLRENWVREFDRFGKHHRAICKGKNIHDFIAWQRGRFDVLVTSYEQATKWKTNILKQADILDFAVFDEAHFLKNVQANRTQAMLGEEASGKDGVISLCERAYHVTGTPMANDPMDIYTFLRFAQAIDIPLDDFLEMFFNKRRGTYGNRHKIREAMLPDLQRLIYNNSIRRTHSDVGLELPDIFLTEVLLEGSTIDINKALEEYPTMERLIVTALEEGRLDLLDAAHIAVVRRLVGKAKAVAYADLLKMELDAGANKRVCFFWHIEPLLYVQARLKKYGYNFGVVYGETADADAQKAIWRHENDPKYHGTLLNIKKGGTGLTLVSGNEVDLVESDWSPAGNAQAIKRVHRYGQERAVRARFITLADSFDVKVNSIVRRKTQDIAQIEGHSMAAAVPA